MSSVNPLKLLLDSPDRASCCCPPLRYRGVADGVPLSIGRLPTSFGVSPAAFHICTNPSHLRQGKRTEATEKAAVPTDSAGSRDMTDG